MARAKKQNSGDWIVRFIASGYGTLTDWTNRKAAAISDFNRLKKLNKEQIGEELGLNDNFIDRVEVRLIDNKNTIIDRLCPLN